MPQVYKAVVIGAGSGGRLSMTGLSNSPRLELAGLSDISPEALDRAEQDYPGVRTYSNHARMVEKERPDVVCISTWPPSHLLLARPIGSDVDTMAEASVS